MHNFAAKSNTFSSPAEASYSLALPASLGKTYGSCLEGKRKVLFPVFLHCCLTIGASSEERGLVTVAHKLIAWFCSKRPTGYA